MAKRTKKSATATKAYNPHESMIIQAGVIFIVISAIIIFAIAYSRITLN